MSPVDLFFCVFREKLSLLLSPEKVLVSEDGHARDWRGIFSLSGMSQSEYSVISQSPDKMNKLLDLWVQRNKDNNNEVTISQLLDSFGIIDRYDVYDDTYLLLSEYYLKQNLCVLKQFGRNLYGPTGQNLQDTFFCLEFNSIRGVHKLRTIF